MINVKHGLLTNLKFDRTVRVKVSDLKVVEADRPC